MSNPESALEAFTIYRAGVALQLQWCSLPSLERQPALRLCVVEQPPASLLLLLTADHCLYVAEPQNEQSLNLRLLRTYVVDLDYCRQTRQLFIVTAEGEVRMQQLPETCQLRADGWQTLSFDPLELCEEGICIERVHCSAQGVVFLARGGELYVMGSCGDVFSAEQQPKHLRLFEEGKELVDMAAGDEHFVALLRNHYPEQQDPLELYGNKTGANVASTSRQTPSPARHTDQLTVDDAERKLELNSNSSVRSYSSSKSSRTTGEPEDQQHVLRKLLLEGYQLLHTQVWSFGAQNNGLLGTGDHIKRHTVNNLQKLESIGVCSIAAGREHSLARSLAGQLYHWGLNTQLQLNGRKEQIDLSAPTPLKLNDAELTPAQRNVLAICCGDYQSVFLNASGQLQLKDKQLVDFKKQLLTLHLSDSSKRASTPLLLAAGSYTLQNHRQFQLQYHNCYEGLQQQLQLLFQYRPVIYKLQLFQEKTAALVLRQLQSVCLCYHKVLCLLTATLKSLERFYRGDYSNPAELLFIQHYRACIELFGQYTKAYCDVYSIDGYSDAAKLYAQLSSVPLLFEQRDDLDLVRICQQPFQLVPLYSEFLGQLLKTRPEFQEHFRTWDAFARQQRIDLELAENTQDFWQRNERNAKIRMFRRKHRRVILTSSTVPLKLAHNTMTISSTSFILFSDCLCQLGSQLQTYPLNVLWLKVENDTALRITTPERSFTVTARNHHDKKLWYDQLESSIKVALGWTSEMKMSNVRNTHYVFSNNHPKYAGVFASGRWRNGVLHGQCHLEYPDGRVYFGQLRNGEIEGYGKMVLPAAGIYEGMFKAGKFHGHGVYEMKDNEVYEGHFRDGLFHGHGLLRSNNYTYVGEYQANAKSGYGILDDMRTGDKYMGMFADNKRIGAGTCITMHGDYFEGMFTNDELAGVGIAVFENGYYYEGELSMRGPIGKGTYYMPISVLEGEDSGVANGDELESQQMCGNTLSGQLSGTWHDVRIVSGTMAMNRHFAKYPSAIGALVVDNTRKWRSLYDNFEEYVLGSKFVQNKKSDSSVNYTKMLWNRIAVFINRQRERERMREQQDNAYQPARSYFNKNISLGFSHSFDKLSLKSVSSLLNHTKSSNLDLSSSLTLDTRRTHSQETLYDADVPEFDCWPAPNVEGAFYSMPTQWSVDSNTPSLRSSFDSVLNISETYNNNSICSQSELDIVPTFGITTLTEQDVAAIKEYLLQAFKERHHPLYVLNQYIENCFNISYGCWKVKPTPILAKQAMREWESISKRVYRFVRKMFPALPEDYCIIESSREVVSHITLLYPIVLSESIYSTLFVLYANKYSRKDEMYRQNLQYAEKLKNEDLAVCLGLDSGLLPIVKHSLFYEAVQTLKQLQEKCSPKAMLTVIENCMQQITDAHKIVANANAVILAADSMMPLTLFLVLRAAVPLLGAELALLDDLTGGPNFQFEMNGIAGYCFTTLKASYEHIIAKPLNKT